MASLLYEIAARPVLIAACVAAVLYIARIRTASARHAAWTGLLALMLLMPLWVLWGPRAALNVLPPLAARTAIHPALHAHAMRFIKTPESGQRPDAGLAPKFWNWQELLVSVYLFGLCALLLRLAAGTVRARAVLRGASSRDGVMASRDCAGPITIGWFRPAVVLPEGWPQWPPEKLNAVLAHEREHARRRDPLVQWLALLNRALFWFHPLAWWLERRLSALSEEVCDAAVLSHGHDPRDYSLYLLDIARSVERSGARLQIAGMAMPGVFLERRLRRMLNACPAPRTSKLRLTLAATVCLSMSVALLTISPQRVRAQSSSAAMAAGLEHALLSLIATAYGVEEYQVKWPGEDPKALYQAAVVSDFLHKMPRETPADQVQQRLQSLLKDELDLTIHHETQTVPLYELTAGPAAGELLHAEPAGAPSGGLGLGPDHIHARNAGISSIAQCLSHNLPRAVVDRTNIAGGYTYNLDWTPAAAEWGRFLGTNNHPDPDTPLAPSLVDALDRLGLKLTPIREIMDVIVVDHIGK